MVGKTSRKLQTTKTTTLQTTDMPVAALRTSINECQNNRNCQPVACFEGIVQTLKSTMVSDT